MYQALKSGINPFFLLNVFTALKQSLTKEKLWKAQQDLQSERGVLKHFNLKYGSLTNVENEVFYLKTRSKLPTLAGTTSFSASQVLDSNLQLAHIVSLPLSRTEQEIVSNILPSMCFWALATGSYRVSDKWKAVW